MNAKHKAPSEVSIAPLAEKSDLQEAVERYWKPVTLAAVLVAAGIVLMQSRSEQARIVADESWDALAEHVELRSLLGGGEMPDAGTLDAAASSLQATPAGPWALAIEARAWIDEGTYDRASATLDTLEAEFPGHPLVATALETSEGESVTAVASLRQMIADRRDWAARLDRLEEPPPVAEDAPRVRLSTGRGDFVVALYPELAPQHVENFLKLSATGFYDGTLFHRTVKDTLIQGGDPNTRDGAPSTWGQGGPEEGVPAEPNDAWHFRGMLAAAATSGNAPESSGSQFYVTTADAHQFDKQYTVFGRVVEGMDVVDAIVAEAPEQGERPANPVELTSTTVL